MTEFTEQDRQDVKDVMEAFVGVVLDEFGDAPHKEGMYRPYADAIRTCANLMRDSIRLGVEGVTEDSIKLGEHDDAAEMVEKATRVGRLFIF